MKPHASTHLRPIVLALVALVVLTTASWLLAHVPLGAAAPVVALGVAVVKASIVGAVFMELTESSTPVRVTIAVTVSFILLLCLGTAGDVLTRTHPGP